MKHIPSPELVQAYKERAEKVVLGLLTLPPIKYDRPPDSLTAFHQSSLTYCTAKAIYRLTMDTPPPLQDDAVWNFVFGRGVERLLGTEQEPVIKDGIITTCDDIHPIWGACEIKATTFNPEKFDPAVNCPSWIMQMMANCYARGIDTMNLLSFHVYSKFVEGSRGGRFPKVVKQPRGWIFTFEQSELDAHWSLLQHRRKVLMRAIEERDEVTEKEFWQGFPGECRYCEFTEMCAYYGERFIYQQ